MKSESISTMPQTIPITVDQYRLLVEHNKFVDRKGQVELIYGTIVEMNPQGPRHADPIDELESWSHQHAAEHFRIRTEKPVEIPGLNSCPEPDIVWVTKRRYADRHPVSSEIHLLIEVSGSSKEFDEGEKRRLYAEAGIPEYWIVDIVAQTIEVMTCPEGPAYQYAVLHSSDAKIAPTCLPSAILSVAQLFSDSVS